MRAIADEQQVFQLRGVLLEQQIDAQHEDVERKRTDEQTHRKHDAHHHFQKPSGLSGIQLVVLRLISTLAEELGDAVVRRVVHLHNEARRLLADASFAIMRIRPCHEAFRHEDGVQAVGESGNLSFIRVSASASRDAHFEVHHVDDSLRNLRKAPALSETEVVKIQVIAGDDDGNHVLTGFEVPVVEIDIHIAVGHRFEEHRRGEVQAQLLHAHTCRHLERRRRELTHSLREGLLLDFLDVCRRERAALAHKRAERAHFLAHDEVILLHEAVAFRKHGSHILIELDAQQDYHHTAKVGEEEADQLADTDMTSHQFPNQTHSINFLV